MLSSSAGWKMEAGTRSGVVISPGNSSSVSLTNNWRFDNSALRPSQVLLHLKVVGGSEGSESSSLVGW